MKCKYDGCEEELVQPKGSGGRRIYCPTHSKLRALESNRIARRKYWRNRGKWESAALSKSTKDFQEKYNNLKPRQCLSCNKMFLSQGPHNRICPECSSSREIVCDRRSHKLVI